MGAPPCKQCWLAHVPTSCGSRQIIPEQLAIAPLHTSSTKIDFLIFLTGPIVPIRFLLVFYPLGGPQHTRASEHSNDFKASNFRRLCGNLTHSKLWLKPSPSTKLCSFGSSNSSRPWFQPCPRLRCCRCGSCTVARLWSKRSPKDSSARLLGKHTPSCGEFLVLGRYV